MGKRINVIIDEDTWRVLGRIPAGAWLGALVRFGLQEAPVTSE